MPRSFRLDAWGEAWATFCIGGTCEGMQRNFFNSLWMTIPATIISTLLGAINGYILSKWRFRGSEVLFTCMLLGVFMPGQIALMPWAFILGKLGLTNTHRGPGARSTSCRASPSPRCSAATTTSASPTT